MEEGFRRGPLLTGRWTESHPEIFTTRQAIAPAFCTSDCQSFHDAQRRGLAPPAIFRHSATLSILVDRLARRMHFPESDSLQKSFALVSPGTYTFRVKEHRSDRPSPPREICPAHGPLGQLEIGQPTAVHVFPERRARESPSRFACPSSPALPECPATEVARLSQP